MKVVTGLKMKCSADTTWFSSQPEFGNSFSILVKARIAA